MTEDITRMLATAVPDDSDPQHWGEMARKRSMRRRSGRITAVAALMVAVAIPVGMALTDPRETAVPAQSPSPSAVPGPPANPCADIQDAMQSGEFRTALDGGKLPDGALQAWLCSDPNRDGDAGPAEPLTVGVTDLVAAFNALQQQPADMACTMEYRYTYTLAFDYADGRKVVSGELHGCVLVSDGAVQLEGGEALLAKAKELWVAQRAASTRPEGDVAVCPPTSSVVMASASDVTRGFACTGTGGMVEITNITELPASLVQEMAASFEQYLVDEVPPQGMSDREVVVLVDDWGSMISLLPLHGEGFAISDPSGTTMSRYWVPPAELAAKIWEHIPEQATQPSPEDICSGAVPVATSELVEFVEAYTCTVGPDGGIVAAKVESEAAKVLASESEGKWTPSGEEPAYGKSLVLIDSDGAAHTLLYQSDGRVMRYRSDYQLLAYTPEAALAAQLADLFGN